MTATRRSFAIGLPLLRKYDIPAVAFVVTGLVGTTQMLWTKEARWLVESGAHLPERPALNADATVALLKKMDDRSRIEALERTTAVGGGSPAPRSLRWSGPI